FTWSVLWHGFANSFEQISQRQSIPIRQKGSARKRRRRFAAGERNAVAALALFLIQRLAAFCLFLCVGAVPHRACFRCRLLSTKRSACGRNGHQTSVCGQEVPDFHATTPLIRSPKAAY